MFKSRIKYPDRNRPRTSFSAADIAKRYGYPTITNQTQYAAVISLGGGYKDSDIAAYCQRYNLPVPPVKFIGVDGATNSPGDPADVENLLDILNIIGASGGKVGVLVYGAPNSDTGFADAIAQVAKDNTACVCTISWGQNESNWSTTAQAAMNKAMQACLSNGIPVFAASGDDGSADGAPGNNVDFPAASPCCIGCGGTTISGGTESAWSYGGGGISTVYPKPSWQAIGGTARGVPDVAGDADPNSGYDIVVNGQWQTVGGTSAVGPMWAAGIALVVSVIGKRLSNLVEGIYAHDLLTDITTGSNGAFKAGIGWDPCTGEGVPNAAFWKSLASGSGNGGGNGPPPPPPPPPPPFTCRQLFDQMMTDLEKQSQGTVFLGIEKAIQKWGDQWLTSHGY